MKLLIVAAAVGVVVAGLVAGGAELCFSKGEETDGLNKICFYSCPSGDAAITVKAYQLCPLSIRR